MTRLRRLLPDVLLVIGIAVALSGAYLLHPAAALTLLGLGVVGLAIWMGA